MDGLPRRPDFEALDAVARDTADRRTLILALIGNLTFGWSNNESLFIYVLMILLETDQTSAAIVFATLNTTRARLDLIQRLAKAKLADRTLAKELDAVVERFNDSTRVRNEFNHCMYLIDDRGEIVQTRSLRIQEVRGRMKLGETKEMDDARVKELRAAVNDLKQLNRQIWDLLPKLEAHFASRVARRQAPPKPA